MKTILLILVAMLVLVMGFAGYEAYLSSLPVKLPVACILGDQPESPIARKGSIYPHPQPPEHLETYLIDAKFKVGRKKANGILRIEQPRPKGGYWFSLACPLEDGKFTNSVRLAPGYKEVLLILVDPATHQQVARATVPVSGIEGEIVLQ
jgi:hypothetical protein